MVQNPCEVAPEDASNFSPQMELPVIDLQANDNLRDIYKENGLLDFYSGLPGIFINLKKFSAGMFIVFGITDICEQTLSKMKMVKTKCR